MFLAYLGIQAGRILGKRSAQTSNLHCEFLLVIYKSHFDRLIRLFAWSFLTILLGLALTAFTLDGGPMPLNKNIWTLSFSLFTGRTVQTFSPTDHFILRLPFRWSRLCWIRDHVHLHWPTGMVGCNALSVSRCEFDSDLHVACRLWILFSRAMGRRPYACRAPCHDPVGLCLLDHHVVHLLSEKNLPDSLKSHTKLHSLCFSVRRTIFFLLTK